MIGARDLLMLVSMFIFYKQGASGSRTPCRALRAFGSRASAAGSPLGLKLYAQQLDPREVHVTDFVFLFRDILLGL
eukprot:1724298-Rhodomonas_salina.5